MKHHVIATVLCAFISPVFALEPDIIIDANTTQDVNFVDLVGSNWGDDNSTANAFRGTAKVETSSTSSEYVRFHKVLPHEGQYSVYVWHNGGSGFYNNALQITHMDGTTTVTLSQSSNAGTWMLVGTYWFDGIDGDPMTTDAEAEVRILGGSGKLSADAVRFVEATPDVLLDSDSVGVTAVGTWDTKTDKAGMGGTIRRTGASGATMTYATVLPTAGDYEVILWLPGTGAPWADGGTAATAFDVVVYHRTGSTTVSVNLPTVLANEGQWVKVVNPATANEPVPRTGTFRFDATPTSGTNPNKVVIKSNGSSTSYVPADALRMTKAGVFSVIMDEDEPAGPPGVTVGQPDPLPQGWASTWANNNAQQTASAWAITSPLRYALAYKSAYFTSSSTSEQLMVYTPAISELGQYDVYLWYPAHNAYYYNNPSTRVVVRSASSSGPVNITKTVNQQNGIGKWTHAGRFTLYPSSDPDSAKRPWVKIATPVNPYEPNHQYYSYWFYYNQGYVLADGVMFVRDGENADTDQDGLPDWHEVLLGSNPNAVDTDSDEINDGDEYRLGLNILSAIVTTTNPSLVSYTVYTPLTHP